MQRILFIVTLLLTFGGSHSIEAQQAKADQELIDLALKISNEMYEGNYQFYDDLFYLDSFLNRVVIDDPNKDLKTFNDEFKQGFISTFSWGGEFYKLVKKGALYEPVSYTAEGNTSYITYSQFSDRGLNYHELELKKIKGKLRIVDVFVYLNGELLSESIRMPYLAMLNSSDLLSKLTGKSKSYMNDIGAILDFNTLAQAKEWQKLDGFLNETTDAFKETKFYYNFKIMSLAGLGNMDDYYDFLKANSSSAVPASYLTNLDMLALEADWPAAHANIDALDNFVGGDPILNIFRANAFLAAGDFGNARNSFQLIYDEFPDYNYGIIGLLSTGLEAGDPILSVNSFVDMKDRFGFTKDDIINIAKSYPVINESKEFKEYKATLD